MEAFYALLVSSGNYNFLPEVYDIFGREDTIKFIEIFAGCTIKVPKVDKLESLARKAEIYIRLSQTSPSQFSSVARVLAEEYNLTEDRVRTTYKETKKYFEKELGFSVIPKRKRATRA